MTCSSRKMRYFGPGCSAWWQQQVWQLKTLHKCSIIPSYQFSDTCTKWPPNDIEDYKVKNTPYMLLKYPRVPSFSLFCSTANCFHVTGHFEKSALNDPQITRNTTSQRYMCYYRATKSYIPSILLCSQLFSSYKLFILRQVHQINLKVLDNYKVKCTICYYSFPVFKISVVLLYIQPFLSSRWFWNKCNERAQRDIEASMVKIP